MLSSRRLVVRASASPAGSGSSGPTVHGVVGRATPVPRGDRVRAGAAPHAMPSPLPSGAARNPVAQPLPEIVNGDGQTADFIAARMSEHLANLQHQAIATHIEPVMYAQVRKLLPGVKYHAGAKCLMFKSEDAALQRLPGTVGVVGAGGPDGAVADTAKLLLQHLGAFVISKEVAGGGEGLAEAAPALQVCDVIIAVAGADASLPAAVASLVDAPVLAVPAAPGHPWSPPHGAAPVAVTAADGGAGAAVMAARMLRTAATRAVQIADAAARAAANPMAAAAASGEAAAHSVQH